MRFLFQMRAFASTRHSFLISSMSGRRSAVDGRTTRHAGYAVSQRSFQPRLAEYRLPRVAASKPQGAVTPASAYRVRFGPGNGWAGPHGA
jgi:hypothetical protein